MKQIAIFREVVDNRLVTREYIAFVMPAPGVDPEGLAHAFVSAYNDDASILFELIDVPGSSPVNK